jgi:hypothetical protein
VKRNNNTVGTPVVTKMNSKTAQDITGTVSHVPVRMKLKQYKKLPVIYFSEINNSFGCTTTLPVAVQHKISQVCELLL